MSTTITFRTDESLKDAASILFASMGMTTSTAINLFLKQAVIQQKFPCPIEAEPEIDARYSYPEGFFSLFGSGKDLDMDIPEDLPLSEVMVL